ncbi:small ribosomal subunit protein uS3m [Prorops nasuta]|uniref:small ribosomal subunit protein uS3m n=1 Tax=Prorops nasuta TaxID=863751 RepID=UPI0034CD3585
MAFVKLTHDVFPFIQKQIINRTFHVTATTNKARAGRYRPTPTRSKPLTYEMANPPHRIAHRKSWNSWNTSNIKDGNRPAETLIEDLFIRKFMVGTWPELIMSEVIIKRQHNIIRIAAIIHQNLLPSKMYFLIGYSEELLSSWLQCVVKLELQTIKDKKEVIYKYV